MALYQRRPYYTHSQPRIVQPQMEGGVFSKYASQYFQGGVPPYFENRQSLARPLLYLTNSTDQIAAIGIWKTMYEFMQNVQPAPRFRYPTTPKNVFKDMIKEIQSIFTYSNMSYTQSRFLSTGPGLGCSNIEKIHFVIGLGIVRETLRDEIICQIMKQCIGNPEQVSVSRGWILLSLALGCFAPSENLRKCLAVFFREENTEHSKFCQQLLGRTLKHGNRKYPPSYLELKAANTLSLITLTVALMDGSIQEINVDAQVTGQEMRAIIAKTVNLEDQFGFSIFCAVENNVKSVGGGNEHIMDYVSQCEQYGKERTGQEERAVEWKIYFAKELFTPWHDPSEDKVSTDLIYCQIVRGIKHGEYRCETKQELAEIAANEYYLTHGQYFDRNMVISLLPSYLPDRALEGNSLENWADLVEESYKKITDYYKDEDSHKIKENIVASARLKWPTIFSRSFDVRQISGPLLPTRSLVMSINWRGVNFYDSNDKSLLYLRYRDIVQIDRAKRSDNVVILATTKQGTYSFVSDSASTIRDILIYIWDGLRRRSRYCIALIDHRGDNHTALSLRRGDIVILDDNHSGQTLNSTGWAIGTNERTGEHGRVSSRYVYVVPVVYLPTVAKTVENKPIHPETPQQPTTSKDELDALMGALDDKDRKLKSKEVKIIELESELGALERKTQESELTLRNEKETFQSLLERKETVLVSTRSELDTLREYNNEASVKLSSMKKSLDEQERELETLRGQRHDQLNDLKNKESALFTNRARLVELERDYSTTNAELESLRVSVKEKEIELNTVKHEQHQNVLLITEMEGSLNATRAELDHFERQNSEAADVIRELRRSVSHQETTIETLKTERDSHFNELQNKEMLLSNTRSELLRLKEENNDSVVTIRDLREKTKDQDEELHMLRMQRVEQNNVTGAQIQQLERSLDEKNVKIKYLMEERDKSIQRHRDEIRELEKRLSELSSLKITTVVKSPTPPPLLMDSLVSREPKSRFHTLEVYSKENFTDNMTWVHQKDQISQPLHKILLRSNEKREKAVGIFRLILIYMEEIPGKRTMSQLQLTDEIFGPALDEEILRDEIYCQLVKQLTFNSNWESEKRCWELMWLCTGLFAPGSSNLLRHVELFFKSNNKPRSNDCLSRLERVAEMGPRRAPPHYMETEAVKRADVPILHKFHLPDESEVTVEIESLSKPPSIQKTIAKKLGLKTFEGFGIFVRVNQQVLGMSETEYLFDFLWLLASLGTPDSPNGIDYELYITKKVWSKTNAGEDPVADCIFHYHQELPRYLLGYHKVSLEEAKAMSGLAYRVYHGEDDRPSDGFPQILDELVPRTHRGNISDSQWVQYIMQEYRKNPGMSRDEAKVAFLRSMQSWPTFGSVFFEAQQEIGPEFPPVVYVAINKHGINIIHTETKELLKNYSYPLLSHWRSGDETFEVIIGGVDGYRIVFKTHLDYEMDDLLTAYVAFYSDQQEAEQLNALWSQTVREILRKQISLPPPIIQHNVIRNGHM